VPLDELPELLEAPPDPPLPLVEPLELVLEAPPVPPDELVVDAGGFSVPQAFAETTAVRRRRVRRCRCMGR